MTAALFTRHPAQQGSRLAWFDTLFDQVEPIHHAAPERPAVADAVESTWDEFDDAQGGDEAMWRVMP